MLENDGVSSSSLSRKQGVSPELPTRAEVEQRKLFLCQLKAHKSLEIIPVEHLNNF